MTTVEPIRNLEHLHKLEDYLAKKSKRAKEIYYYSQSVQIVV